MIQLFPHQVKALEGREIILSHLEEIPDIDSRNIKEADEAVEEAEY